MLNVSRGALEEYSNLVLKWNKKINLISSNTSKEIFTRHVEDSLQLMNYIDEGDKIIDIGSGAGFPAIVLSIAGVLDITLIESDSRKAAFLLQASKLSKNKVEIINDRVENLYKLECDVLTSRAFSSLSEIFEYTQNITIRDKYLLHKGANYKSEIMEAQKHWLFDFKVHDSITSESGKILEIPANVSKNNIDS